MSGDLARAILSLALAFLPSRCHPLMGLEEVEIAPYFHPSGDAKVDWLLRSHTRLHCDPDADQIPSGVSIARKTIDDRGGGDSKVSDTVPVPV